MTFPQTRITLIRRICAEGSEQDWQQFLEDYWAPICRFATRQARLSIEDAEDVASSTFAALLSNDLLSRWQDQPAAKLRTLLCSVVRNLLSNRARVTKGRERLLQEAAAAGGAGMLRVQTSHEVPAEQEDAFYLAWVDEVLRQTINHLMHQLHRDGKGDYFRVLYGRLCEELTIPQIANALDLKTTTVENYFKAAKKALAGELERRVRKHVIDYCGEDSAAEEFAAEWKRLGDHLHSRGGLERAVKKCNSESEFSAGSDSFLSTKQQLGRAFKSSK